MFWWAVRWCRLRRLGQGASNGVLERAARCSDRRTGVGDGRRCESVANLPRNAASNTSSAMDRPQPPAIHLISCRRALCNARQISARGVHSHESMRNGVWERSVASAARLRSRLRLLARLSARRSSHTLDISCGGCLTWPRTWHHSMWGGGQRTPPMRFQSLVRDGGVQRSALVVAFSLAVVTPQPSAARAPWAAQASCRNFPSSSSLMPRPIMPCPLMHRHLMATRMLPGSRGRRSRLALRAELASGCLRRCRSGMRRERIAGRQPAHHRTRNPCGVISRPKPRP